MSYGTFPKQRYHNRSSLKAFLEQTLSRDNVLFGARNDGSKPWLESILGYPSEKITSIPDPGLYVPTAPVTHLELSDQKLNVLVALNGEMECYRFGGRWPDQIWKYTPGWKARKAAFFRGLSQALERLSRKHDVNLIICAHCTSDFKMLGEFFSYLPARLRDQQVVMAPILKARSAPYFYDLYRQADLAISMRIHSMDCATGVGTPFIGLDSHPRMRWFMADAGLTDFLVDAFSPDLAEEITTRADQIFERRHEVKKRLQVVRAQMRVRTTEFNRRVAALLNASTIADLV